MACLCVGLVLAIRTGTVRAQQEGLAESLFEEARESMKRGQPQQACPKFEESQRLDPSLGTLLNLGLCEEQLGRLATAWTKLREFVETAPNDDPRLTLAQRRIAGLEPKLPKLRVLVLDAEGSATVQLDGVELGRASLGLNLPVDPGEHSLLLALPTGESRELRVRLAVAEQLDVTLVRPDRAALPTSALLEQSSPLRVASASVNAPPLVRDRGPEPGPNRVERRWAYAVGAVGVAGLLTSGVFGLLALHEKSVVREHCPDSHCQDQRGLDALSSGTRDETIANVTFVAGALAVGAGALLYWHSGRSSVSLQGGAGNTSIGYRLTF